MFDSLSFSRRALLQAGAAGLAAGAAPRVLAHGQPSHGALQIVGPWEIGGLAPASSGYIFTRLQIAETLLEAADDGTPLPGLARQWQASADGKVWRFTLRSAARFHDGTPVTAHAVVRCLQAARIAPALLSTAPVQAVEADGGDTVVIRLTGPYGGLPALLAHSSTLILAPSSYGADGGVRRIVGSGPYRVALLAPPQRVDAQVADTYDGPRPEIERVSYLVASRPETRALMAESGQADLAYGLDPASVQRLRRRGRVPVQAVTVPRTMIVKVNAGLPALRDVRVRQALSMALDRRGIALAVLRAPELAATQLFPPTLAGWHDPTLTPLIHDPEAAARLLVSAGWRRAADGLRDAQGQPLSLSLRTFPDRPELPIIATVLQEQWRQAGIAVSVRIGNSGDIPIGHRDGSLQLGLVARNYATVPDPAGTLLQDFGAGGGDWGAMGWHNQALEANLIDLVQGNLPPAMLSERRRRVAGLLHAELPVIPVAWYRQQVAVSSRLSGVSLDPLERSYRLTQIRWRS